MKVQKHGGKRSGAGAKRRAARPQVKNALRYVAENARRHAEKLGLRVRAIADRFTSLGTIDLTPEPRLAAIAADPPTGAAPLT